MNDRRQSITLVKGGQGRTPDQVEAYAEIVFWLWIAVFAAVTIGLIIQGVM